MRSGQAQGTAGGTARTPTPRRAQILQAALQLFSERGFRETSTAALAARVGVSEGALYRHFSGKEEIFAALVEQEMKKLDLTAEGISAEELSTERMLEAVARQVVRVYEESPAAMSIILGEALRSEKLATLLYDRLLGPAAVELENFLSRRIAAGELRPHNPSIVSAGFLSMLAFYMMVTQLVLPRIGRTGDFSSEEIAGELSRLATQGLLQVTSRPADTEAARDSGEGLCG